MKESHKENTMRIGSNSLKIVKQFVIGGILFFTLLIFEINNYSDFGDDLTYAKAWTESSLHVFLKERYAWWSSRVVIEAVMMPLVAFRPYIWYILNACMILILIWITADLFVIEDKEQAKILIFVLMWLVPLDMVIGAGWITTTVNYLWPLALGLVAMRPLKHWVKDEKCATWEYIVCPFCILYAANMEQMAAILLGVYLVFGTYFLFQKRKLPFFYMMLLALIVVSLQFILNAPGNGRRYSYEMERYFPEFEELGVGSKLLMGFLETAYYFIGGGKRSCDLFACMSIILFFCFLTGKLCGKERAPIQKGFIVQFCIALWPMTACWVCTYFFPFLLYKVNVSRARNLLWCFIENRNIPIRSTFPAYIVIIQIIFYLTVFVCLALSIYFIHGKNCETIFEFLILCAGFASRIIMGFSPTIYESGSRTALFCSMAILIVILRNLQIWMRKEQKTIWKLLMGVVIGYHM